MDDNEDPDFLFGRHHPDANQLGNIGLLVSKARRLQLEIEQFKEAMEQSRIELDDLVKIRIPSIMQEAGTISYTTNDGVTVEVEQMVGGSLPKVDEKKRALALNILRKAAPKLIKNQILIEIKASAEGNSILNHAISVLDEGHISYTINEDVHHSTLRAFARECLKKGKKIELEKIGISLWTEAKLIAKQEDKKK